MAIDLPIILWLYGLIRQHNLEFDRYHLLSCLVFLTLLKSLCKQKNLFIISHFVMPHGLFCAMQKNKIYPINTWTYLAKGWLNQSNKL